MVSDFRNFIRETSAESCVVVGASPSLGTVANHQNCTSFWLGDAHRRTNVQTKHQIYVRANSEYPSLENQQHIEELKGRQFSFIFAETVMESTTPVVQLFENSGLEPAYVFDQRHFGGKACVPPQSCCQVLQRETPEKLSNITLQEFLSSKFGLQHHYSSGDTVALHAYALSLLTGAKSIYLTGIDLPFYQKDYVYPQETLENKRTFPEKFKELIVKIRKYRPSIKSIIKEIVRRLGQSLKMNSSQVSVFGEDFPSLFSDFQYLVDLGLQNGVTTYYCSENSNLRKVNGIVSCPICIK